jgi:Domain of unknown function (DUF4411)
VKYVIDTSALIDWWVRFYPPESFPTLLTHMEALIAAGDLRSSRAVLDELERQDDDLAKWAKAQQGFFIEDGDEVQDQVGYLVNKYFNEDKPEKGINGADPFVIGLAVTAANPPLTVISGENPGSKENPKIPWVCKEEGVPHNNFLGLIKAEGWKL